MNKKTVKDYDVKGKTVLLRADYNVSLSGKKITDDTRIAQTLPTIKYLLSKNCPLIIISHLGRPKGKKDSLFSLSAVAKDLQKISHKKVYFEKDYLTPESRQKIKKKAKKGIVLLENLRFHPGEETNNEFFARQLAGLGEIYVNDAFGSSHRRHASVVGAPRYLPAVAGLLLQKEVDIISKTLAKPKHPFVAIIGGAKTETKIEFLRKLIKKADRILLGGCISIYFLKAKGFSAGQFKINKKTLDQVEKIINEKQKSKSKIILPADVVMGKLKTGDKTLTCPVDKISPNLQILDIGSQTEAIFGNIIAGAKTIIWNGPVGAVEKKGFRRGTEFVFYSIAQNKKADSLIGGGDTIASLPKKDYLSAITHLSTGGGAMLEFIEKGTLPGIEVLEDK